jgi:hypothetical protein
MHPLAHEHRLLEQAEAKKGETKLKGGHKRPRRVKARLERSVGATLRSAAMNAVSSSFCCASRLALVIPRAIYQCLHKGGLGDRACATTI